MDTEWKGNLSEDIYNSERPKKLTRREDERKRGQGRGGGKMRFLRDGYQEMRADRRSSTEGSLL